MRRTQTSAGRRLYGCVRTKRERIHNIQSVAFPVSAYRFAVHRWLFARFNWMPLRSVETQQTNRSEGSDERIPREENERGTFVAAAILAAGGGDRPATHKNTNKTFRFVS